MQNGSPRLSVVFQLTLEVEGHGSHHILIMLFAGYAAGFPPILRNEQLFMSVLE